MTVNELRAVIDTAVADSDITGKLLAAIAKQPKASKQTTTTKSKPTKTTTEKTIKQAKSPQEKEVNTELDAIQKELNNLLQKAEALKQKKLTDKMNKSLTSLQRNSEAISHSIKSAEYCSYKESEAYVKSLAAELEATGYKYETATGTPVFIKFTGDSTLKTFTPLAAGQVITSDDSTPLLVKSFAHSYAGSTAEVIPLSLKYYVDGERKTPASGTPCHYDRATGQVITPKYATLDPKQQIILGDTRFIPAARFAEAHYSRYSLERVQ